MADSAQRIKGKNIIGDKAINPRNLSILIIIHSNLIVILIQVIIIAILMAISFLVSSFVLQRTYERNQDIIIAPPPADLKSFDLPVVSKTTADVDPHFIKIKVSLGYEANDKLSKELSERKEQILHVVSILLQSKKREEIDTIDDKQALAEEIKAHINVLLIEGKIKDVYFVDFIIQ